MVTAAGRGQAPWGPSGSMTKEGPSSARSVSKPSLLHASASSSTTNANNDSDGADGGGRRKGETGGGVGSHGGGGGGGGDGGARRQLQTSLAVILAGLCGLYAAGLLPSAMLEEPVSYVIVVDGGSSGSRVHVFSMYIRGGAMPVLKAEEGVLKVRPGLSTFRDDPTRAGASLQPLFAFAEKYVPHGSVHRTPIVLMATAGLRSVGSEAAETILESCRTALRATKFRFEREWAEVLPGSKEGLYAWIAANYAAGTLSKADPAQTLGVIELGGASMQITFAPKRVPPKQFREELRVAGGASLPCPDPVQPNPTQSNPTQSNPIQSSRRSSVVRFL